MPRKQKFKPSITRVKLNPEQAVLACDCWNNGTNMIMQTGGGWASWDWGLGGPLWPCWGKQVNTPLYVKPGGGRAFSTSLASS